MRSTYTHRLASGIEVEFKRMMSYHQEWLSKGKTQKSTKSKTNKSDKNIDDVMADITVRIGGLNIENHTHEEKLSLIQSMLSPCLVEMLMAARFFSVDIHFAERQAEYNKYLASVKQWEKRCDFVSGKVSKEELEAQGVDVDALLELDEEKPEYVSEYPDHIFSFTYGWKEKDENGHLTELSHSYDLPIHFHEFEFTAPYKLFTEIPTKAEKKHIIKLPINGQEVQWTMLDVEAENIYKGDVTRENLTANTPIKWRNPVTLEKKSSGDGVIPISLNTSKMEILDIEALRKDIFSKEGRADTTIQIKHPNNDTLTKLDILQVVTFFIPSGVA